MAPGQPPAYLLGMTYQVDYFDAKGLTGSDANPPSFAAAKELAERAVETGVALRAEVRDASGRVVYRRPRVVGRA